MSYPLYWSSLFHLLLIHLSYCFQSLSPLSSLSYLGFIAICSCFIYIFSTLISRFYLYLLYPLVFFYIFSNLFPLSSLSYLFHLYILYSCFISIFSAFMTIFSTLISILSTISYLFHLYPPSFVYLLPISLFHLLLLFHLSPSSPHLPLLQPAPASAVGEESEEDQKFRTIFQEIAGDVSEGVLCVYVSLCIPVCLSVVVVVKQHKCWWSDLPASPRRWRSQPTSWRTCSTKSSPRVSPHLLGP